MTPEENKKYMAMKYEGWKWDMLWSCWRQKKKSIFPVNGSFVISEDHVWLPGSFASFEDAEAALCAA